jgi:hypothetical protein
MGVESEKRIGHLIPTVTITIEMVQATLTGRPSRVLPAPSDDTPG